MGHPYYDFIDNSSGFEQKIRRVIEVCVCVHAYVCVCVCVCVC